MEREIGFGSILKAAIVAGLLAGLLVAGFHFAITEPIIEQAIEMEEAASHSSTPAEEPVVSRPAQRGGLFLGYVIYGLSWSLLFAVAFHLVQRRLPPTTVAQRSLLLALAAYWAVALLPFLKYPANPPGVGDPETIGVRQGLYLALLALGVLTTALALGLGRWIQRSDLPAWAPWAVTVAIALGSGAILLAAMPDNPDAIHMPTWLVSSFRTLSLVGATLFWVILGGGFAIMMQRLSRGPVSGAT